MVLAGVLLAANLVAVGDFEAEKPPRAYGFHCYGDGVGVAERVRRGADGGWCARLAMERGPGGAKAAFDVPIAGLERLRISFRHRLSCGLGAVTVRFGTGMRKSFVPAKGPSGKPVVVKHEIHPCDVWTNCTFLADVPPDCRGAEGSLSVHFVVWGGREPCELLLDDIAVEPVTPERKTVAPPVKISFLPHGEPAEPADLGPVPDAFAFSFAAKDGLMVRNGRPHFWFGDGCSLSGYASSPAGLWLARLQGVEMVTQNGAAGASGWGLRDKGAEIDLWGTSAPGYYSWYRENLRFGMLTESAAGAGKWWRQDETAKVRQAHPDDFGEAVYNRGHFMGVDPLAKFGREIMLTKRLAWFDKIKSSGRMIAELNREPGPNPFNQRVRRDFRTWLAKKYGDLSTLNAVWGTSFANWDEVGPAHLPPKEGQYGHVVERDLRFGALEKNPPRYFDWCAFMIDDCTESNRVETEDLRRHWPHWITCDTRSHPCDEDGYSMYAPDRLEPLWDVFFIHQGWFPVKYAVGPYDEATLLKTSAFPLFCFNYYRTNLRKPIVSTENVVAQVGVPGSNRVAMERNDIAKLHGTWDFQLAETPDEDAWRPIVVPGCWDELPEWKAKSGTGWYRRRFTVPAAYGHDYEDGSRRILLYGLGVAQNGEFFLNGEKVGELTGKAWDTKYAFDVGARLRYGGENELLVKVNGTGYQNGLRGYIHLLGDDMITESSAPDARMHRHMLWSFMMGGVSGEFNWNWNREDPIRPYLPELLAKMNAVAPSVMPDVRNRRSRVAVLHAYLWYRGLPHRPEGRMAEPVRLVDACTFLGVRPSVVSEWKLPECVASGDFDTLIVPEAEIVEDTTYAAVKAFLSGGGTVLLSGRGLSRTFSRYAPTDVSELASQVGRGRLVRLPPDLTLEATMTAIGPYLPPPDLPVEAISKPPFWCGETPHLRGGGVLASPYERGFEITSVEKANPTVERPMVERVLAGDADRKVVYLGNWGACRQQLQLTLPKELAGWTMTVLEGAFEKRGVSLTATVDSQDVSVALLERPGVPTCWRGVSPARAEAMARVVELMRPETLSIERDSRKKVLFPDENRTFRDAFTGMKLYPYWVKAFRDFGCRVECVPRDSWDDELLSRYDVVVLPENYKAQWVESGGAKRFSALMRTYAERGGSICSFANVNGLANNVGRIAGAAAGLLGATWSRDGEVFSSRCAGFGDARQARTDAVKGPMAEGVRQVQLYTGRPFVCLKKRTAFETVVAAPSDAESGAGAPVMISGSYGKGRVFISADAMFAQPLRIEEADNAKLLMNVVGWLLGETVTEERRKAFCSDLFLTREVFQSR